jgi:hypothetical protein
MGLQKVIQAGPATITLSEGAGVASVQLALDQSVGGGAAEGVIKAKAAIEIDLQAQQVADLAIGLLEVKFPSLAGILEGVKGALDAELQKA